MAAIPGNIPLSTLCSHLDKATSQQGFYLDNTLQLCEGNRSKGNPHGVINAILERLERTIAAEESPNTLADLREKVNRYCQKMDQAASVRSKGHARKIDPEIVKKISTKIVELIEVIHKTPLSSYQVNVPAKTSSQVNIAEKILHILVTETTIINAAAQVGNLIDDWFEIRRQAHDHKMTNLSTETVDQSSDISEYFDLPLPLFLLECHLSRLLEIETSPDSPAIKKTIERILRAKQRFPNHSESISLFILKARWRQLNAVTNSAIDDLLESISEHLMRNRTDEIGPAMRTLINGIYAFAGLAKESSKENQRLLTDPPTSLQELGAIRRKVSDKKAEMKQGLRNLCQKCTQEHIQSSSKWITSYGISYLGVCALSGIIPCTEQCKNALPYYPHISGGIFEKESLLHFVVPTTIPSPNELLSSLKDSSHHPLSKTAIDTFIEEFEARRTSPPPPRPCTKDFLPKGLPIASVKKRSSPPPEAGKKSSPPSQRKTSSAEKATPFVFGAVSPSIAREPLPVPTPTAFTFKAPPGMWEKPNAFFASTIPQFPTVLPSAFSTFASSTSDEKKDIPIAKLTSPFVSSDHVVTAENLAAEDKATVIPEAPSPEIELEKSMADLHISPPPLCLSHVPELHLHHEEELFSEKDSSPHPMEEISKSTSSLPVEDTDESRFSFHKGSGPNHNFWYGWNVRRWWSSTYDPLVKDPAYSTHNYPPEIQGSIRFRHTVALALTQVVVECGKKFVLKDGKGRTIRESYTMPADVTWTDGSKRFERGIITVAYDPRTREFFHVGFSLKAPSTMRDEYLRDGYLVGDIEEPSQMPKEAGPHPKKTLPDDGSRITRIDDFGVDVIDPKNQVVFETFFYD